ncbi:MAG: hypothetical protein II789_07860 [Clostridia bacterium]|nr:hypothetical protein [Clostridia bacterium]
MNNVMELEFYGSQTAELFSKELKESLAGVLRHLMVTDENDPNCGFTPASLPGHSWCDTMWTRDAGTLLRELVCWGRLHEACLLTDQLLRLVGKNEQGYYTFPEYFWAGKVRSGRELDGTGSILIALISLYGYLPEGDRTRQNIKNFLLDAASPVNGILDELRARPLLAGSGEFGGGCFVEGEHVNVVQNNLIRIALIAAAGWYLRVDARSMAERCAGAAAKLKAGIKQYLIDDNGCLIWCVDPVTLRPDPSILERKINRGSGLINGVLTMTADVCGMSLRRAGFFAYDAAEKTFDRLYNTPLRHELFEKYGIWTQFDDWVAGFTGPSYGQGYAIQSMLLLDRLDMAGKALRYLAEETFSPLRPYKIKRESPYYFFERYYCPYSIEQNAELEVGCGPLNVVCVAEPLKIGRMLAGLDLCGEKPVIAPRLPEGFDGYEAKDVLFPTGDGWTGVNISCRKEHGQLQISIERKA